MAVQLSKRDRAALGLAGVFVLVFVVVQFVVYPAFARRADLERKLAVKTRMYEEMVALKAKYDLLNKKSRMIRERFAQREKKFTLFSFMDRLAGDAGIKENISYMKPSSSGGGDDGVKLSRVEMKVKSVTLGKLVTYLYKVESSKNMVYVKTFSVTKGGKERRLIDTVIQVETVEI